MFGTKITGILRMAAVMAYYRARIAVRGMVASLPASLGTTEDDAAIVRPGDDY